MISIDNDESNIEAIQVINDVVIERVSSENKVGASTIKCNN